ncbi:MAG: TolC family outer membrane protein [Hyphomicrobiales bacterium]|nr:TolC family outer membrane protein [Hyphomicrobiales bacterium]
MASSYMNNPDLNAARAQMRAIDEGVPQARAGGRPRLSLDGNYGLSTVRSVGTSKDGTFDRVVKWAKPTNPRGVALSVEQPIFLGFRTKNSVRVAETSVKAAREQLKVVEQNVLLDTVRAFMGVIRAQVVVNLTAQNVQFLREQVKAAQDRLSVGEGTRTDVAQTEARLSQGLFAYAQAVADLSQAIAVYVQVVGNKPDRLGDVNGVDKYLPATLDAGLEVALTTHPSIVAGLYNIDVASWNVRVREGALKPTVTLQGSVGHRNAGTRAPDDWTDTASITGRLTMPLYQGGEIAAAVRELKETLGQRRIELDVTRAEVRQFLTSAWAILDATKAQIRAAAAQVAAQQLVLSGVIEERRVGQRTTLDVLDAQQDLLTAQVEQVRAQHDRVVAAYSLLAAYGRLNAEVLGLPVQIYDPTEHYYEVKDKWLGLRTPDGR